MTHLEILRKQKQVEELKDELVDLERNIENLEYDKYALEERIEEMEQEANGITLFDENRAEEEFNKLDTRFLLI